MANETTQTQFANSVGLQISEVIGSSLIPVPKPAMTVTPLINHDSIAGEATETKRYGKEDDEGPGVAGSENTDLTTNTLLNAGTAVDVSVGENSTRRIEITDRAVERMIRPSGRGFSGNIGELFQRADPAELIAAIGPFKKAMVDDIWEKVEADVVGAFSGLSTTAGTGTTEFGVADFIDAQYKLGVAEALGQETVACLTHRQVKSLRLELGATDGGLGGGVWANPNTNVGMLDFKGIHGYVDNLMGTHVFVVSESVKDTAGTDEYGAMFMAGAGSAPDAPGNRALSPFVYLEGRPDITYYAELSAGGRKLICVASLVYGVAEIFDGQGVALISDNA